MKTQVNTLVNGSRNVRGNKTQVVGSSFEDRAVILKAIKDENPQSMRVSLYGVEVELSAHYSCSGRLTGWSAAISEETAKAIIGGVPAHTYDISYSLNVYSDLTFEVCWYIRKNERCTWKPSGSLYIKEEEVTIL